MEISNKEVALLVSSLREIYLLKSTVWKQVKHNMMELEPVFIKINEMEFEAAKRLGAKFNPDGTPVVKEGMLLDFPDPAQEEEYRKWRSEYLEEKVMINLLQIPESAIEKLEISGITYEGLKPILT
jgi:hypothetical protein